MHRALRIDTHAHLYDTYSAEAWCYAAFRNLAGSPEAPAIVMVVDRDGQDSLGRLRREVPSFGQWQDVWNGKAGIAHLAHGQLFVVQGVQYVTRERLEVLGFGVQRVLEDGEFAAEYIARIVELDGLACLPWSPGKWLGRRGGVVRGLLDTVSKNVLSVGDISMRPRLGPPSILLSYARHRGFQTLLGTDPLPPKTDEELVGSLGIEVSLRQSVANALSSWSALKVALLSSESTRQWGVRNSPLRAVRRFVCSIR
jgi:hypothetical protein